MKLSDAQSARQSFDLVYGLDRCVVSVIEGASTEDLNRLSGLIALWQLETDTRLARARQQAGTLS